MLRKMLMLLLTAAMLLSCAAAEEAENPFIGTWNVMYGNDGDDIEDYSDYGKRAAVVFEADMVHIIDGEDIMSFPCIYADGVCLMAWNQELMQFSIGEDGLMKMQMEDPSYEAYAILSREAAAGYDAPFLGYWKRLNADSDAGNILLFAETYVYNVGYDSYVECTYAADGCTLYQSGAPAALCTIDENGVMTFSILNTPGSYQLVRTEYAE